MKTTCGIIIYDKEVNKILCCHPTDHPNNVWSIPKGMFEKNKDASHKDAALRELQEETNITFDRSISLGLLSEQEYRNGNKKLIPFFIVVSYHKLFSDLKCNSYFLNKKTEEITSEIDKFKWFDLDEAIKVVHPTQVNSLLELKQKLTRLRIIE